MTKKGITIITNAGGVGVITVDNLDFYGLPIADLSPITKEKLLKELNFLSGSLNPVDVLGDATSKRYLFTTKTILEDENSLAILVLMTPQVVTDCKQIALDLVEIINTNSLKKPLIPVFIGGPLVEVALNIFKEKQIPVFETPESAIIALKNLYKYNFNKFSRSKFSLGSEVQKDKNDQFLEEIKKKQKKKLDFIHHKIKAFQQAKKTTLDFETIVQIANIFKLNLADFKLIKKNQTEDIQNFLDEKKEVVLKVVSDEILHRTEQKMVETGVSSIATVNKFLDKFPTEKIILQETVKKAIECFIGINRDPQFGLTFICGSGGIYAENYADFSLSPVPTTKAEIEIILQKTKLYKVLTGLRQKFFDLDFYIQTIWKLTQVAIEFSEIQSIDINPFMALEKGGKIVDFKISL